MKVTSFSLIFLAGITYMCPFFLLSEDELQNVEMAEEEKTKERNETKIKRRDYTGYDDEEFVAGREGMKRAVLSKYDEFLEGPKETVSALLTIFPLWVELSIALHDWAF